MIIFKVASVNVLDSISHIHHELQWTIQKAHLQLNDHTCLDITLYQLQSCSQVHILFHRLLELYNYKLCDTVNSYIIFRCATIPGCLTHRLWYSYALFSDFPC